MRYAVSVLVNLIVLTVVLFSQTGPEEYRRVLEVPGLQNRIPIAHLTASENGKAFGISSHEFLLVQNGAVDRRYSLQGHNPVASVIAAEGDSYLLFWNTAGGGLQILDSSGASRGSTELPGLPRPLAFAVEPSREFVVLVRPYRHADDIQHDEPLIYRYNLRGELLGRQFHGWIGRSDQRFMMAVNEIGDVAFLKADERKIYWIDATGAVIQQISVTGMISALGFVGDSLQFICNKRTPRPSPEGVFIFSLSEPKIVHHKRDGETTITDLSEDLVGISQISPDGNLLRADQNGVVIFKRYLP